MPKGILDLADLNVVILKGINDEFVLFLCEIKPCLGIADALRQVLRLGGFGCLRGHLRGGLWVRKECHRHLGLVGAWASEMPWLASLHRQSYEEP
jgi:hypothetical protein